jgi:hypothetical protein
LTRQPYCLSPAEFAHACAKTFPVALVGAGISMLAPACLPAAMGLLREFQGALARDVAVRKLFDELPPEPFAQLLSPEVFYNAVSEYSISVAADVFRRALSSEEPNLNHWMVAGLLRCGVIARIVTTNFDDLLERSLANTRYRLHSEEQESGGERSLWKLHGDLGERMAIAMSDVATVGFSATPGTLAREIAGRDLIVVGYSGNDPHVLRALVDARPGRVWWVVRRGDRPPGLMRICRSLSDVAIVEGDIASVGDDNPLVALWSVGGDGAMPLPLVARARDSLAHHDRRPVFAALEKLTPGLKALMVHSLVRRAGVETTAQYREALSTCLKNSLFAGGFSDSLSWAIHKDISDAYESMLHPYVYARAAVLEHHGAPLSAADRWRRFGIRLEALELPIQAMILLDAGLERLYHGDAQGATPAIQAALQCARSIGATSVVIRASEALAWTHLANFDLEESGTAHSAYQGVFEVIRQDIRSIARGIDALEVDRFLMSCAPPDEPHIYRLFSVDKRLKRRLGPLKLAGRLRYYGRPDLALAVLEASSKFSLPNGAYAKVLDSFWQLERARCQALLARCEEALSSLHSARSCMQGVEDSQGRVLEQFHRLASACFVRLEQLQDALVSHIDGRRIPR